MKSINLELFFGLLLGVSILGFIRNKFLGSSKESFVPSFSSCRNQGYTKAFCTQTPTGVMGPGTCRCWTGEIGRREPGFGGACVCGNGGESNGTMGGVGSSGDLGGKYNTSIREVGGHFF